MMPAISLVYGARRNREHRTRVEVIDYTAQRRAVYPAKWGEAEQIAAVAFDAGYVSEQRSNARRIKALDHWPGGVYLRIAKEFLP
jgi:hypothetical protein